MSARIVHWIVAHILRPKNGSYSRVDRDEFGLIFAILRKVKIDWPFYFISTLKVRNKGTSKLQAFGYNSMISVTLNHFNVGENDIVPLKKFGGRQTFNTQTMNGFRYYFDEKYGWQYKSKSDIMIHRDQPDSNDLSGGEEEKDEENVCEFLIELPKSRFIHLLQCSSTWWLIKRVKNKVQVYQVIEIGV